MYNKSSSGRTCIKSELYCNFFFLMSQLRNAVPQPKPISAVCCIKLITS